VTPNDLRRRVKQRPFKPFRMVVSEGATYDITHPEQIIIARDSVGIGLPSESDEFYEGFVVVDLLHVVRLEPLNGKPAKPKKASGG